MQRRSALSSTCLAKTTRPADSQFTYEVKSLIDANCCTVSRPLSDPVQIVQVGMLLNEYDSGVLMRQTCVGFDRAPAQPIWTGLLLLAVANDDMPGQAMEQRDC
eukprot:353320-Chlamydomonas_euryale.AAC.2